MPTGLARSPVVQRCPLGSGGTGLGRSLVEVTGLERPQQCPLTLGSGAGGSWQLRSSSVHCDQEARRRRRRGELS